ncbi:uncharacterized protein BCR38DRAFT_445713 [Pseudomassariella vexata]|uniref:Pentatricopeptide repeat domain-containing protein n=1 Tax=Pseudomassariella vexata TaxID=1141098 RepID=A0A1Y2DJ38_9PEZI|nr:uncharacterized protein BCR38DRAFT_445713 [Pseudomassariella vexata]ORY59144.1 hypothetical protein BCR38DRAFT_445713 [Pseudomassariella vexata]
MKASRSICLLCRHRLATKATPKAPQWPSHAPYSTGGSSAPAGSPAGEVHAREDSNSKPAKFSFRRVLSKDLPIKDPLVPNSRPSKRRNAGKKTTADMDQLFQDIVNKKPDNITAENGPSVVSIDMQLVNDIGKLQLMLDNNIRVSRAYVFLRTELYPSIRREGVHIPQIFFRVVSSLMQKIISIKKDAMEDPELPPVAEIFRVCADIGEMRPGQWTVLVGKLVENLCDMSISPDDYPSIEAYEKHLATREEMITDLVESWKVLSLPKHMIVKPSGHENEIMDGFWLPRLDKLQVKKYAPNENLTLAFSRLFPQYPPDYLGPKVSALALATFALLMDTARSSAAARRSASRFLAKVAYLIVHVRIRQATLRDNLRKTLPLTEDYVMRQWPKIQEYLTRNGDPSDEPTTNGQNAAYPTARRSFFADSTFMYDRLSRAYGTRDGEEVDRLWQLLIGASKEPMQTRAATFRHHPDLFNSFINIYMAMNQPDKAIMVWNSLPKVGLKPTLKTWNVMLDGCKRARNASGLKNVWAKLVSSGITLDESIWTTRISGLMESGEPEAAIKALEEMVHLWNDGNPQETKVAIAVRPGISPVNAALAGLIRLERLDKAQKLLAWAGRQNILPDILTFNTLLRPLIRDNRDEEVKSLFSTMQDLGIHADEATFTIVLDGALARIDPNQPEQQVKVVSAVFEEMHAAGLEANLQTYGKMIYLLLRSGDRATESVKTVLEHLWAHGHELSPHIYTMLVEHYFSRHPPDLHAVDSLLQRRRLLDYDDMDRVFYDRIIKGYALVGDMDTSLDIYRKLTAAGFLVDVATQFELLKVLLRAQRAQDARELVECTVRKYREQHGAGFRGSSHARFWGHRFWDVAGRNGLLLGVDLAAERAE